MPNALPKSGDAIVFFDVESAPCSKQDVLWLKLSSQVEVRDGESEDEYENRLAGIHRWTCLSGPLGRVWMIGYAVGSGDPVIHAGDGTEKGEPATLQAFYDDLKDLPNPWFVGHNITGFDIPFLQVRALRHGLPQLARFLGRASTKPWDQRYIDTMKIWPRTSNYRSGWRDGMKGLGKLDTLCEVLGVETQDGLMGSEVYDAFLRGDTEGCFEHLRLDIIQIREVFRLLWPLL